MLRLLWLAAGQEHFYTTEGYDQGTNVLRMVGYFSLVGLLRVHTLVGDYQGALKALGVIHPFQRSHLFTPKIASQRPTSLLLCSDHVSFGWARIACFTVLSLSKFALPAAHKQEGHSEDVHQTVALSMRSPKVPASSPHAC